MVMLQGTSITCAKMMTLLTLLLNQEKNFINDTESGNINNLKNMEARMKKSYLHRQRHSHLNLEQITHHDTQLYNPNSSSANISDRQAHFLPHMTCQGRTTQFL
jgi:hypothetical protein